jgi:phospholipase C
MLRYMASVAAATMSVLAMLAVPARADGNLHNVKHIVIIMQENHSFDNYFGALPYAPGGPYHSGPCAANDHSCVDGLTCTVGSGGALTCNNSNADDDGSTVYSFHDSNYCPAPDLQHDWPGSHHEANWADPSEALFETLNNGFVLENDLTEQLDTAESATDDDTMGFYNQADLPFYYQLAETFAIDDRYFCPVIGPTFPNRSYAMAATSFGHLTTAEIFPPPGGYQPITGTIFDLLDEYGVSWTNFYQDLPTSFIFHPQSYSNVAPISAFFAEAEPGTLPQVSFVDPSFFPDQVINGGLFETDEHPPFDIRAGEYRVWQLVNAVRNGPNWKDTIIFITYDEHGGFYDHVPPPPASQGGALSPDGINPGQCEDLSNPPASEQPGGGAQCTISASDAASICPGFTPTGPYPASCANFNQEGFRVPFIAVSPFSKPHYVSHTVADHTAMLALIEKRFLSLSGATSERPHLTARDLHAPTLEDMFDFDHSPSLHATFDEAPAPVAGEDGCPVLTAQ